MGRPRKVVTDETLGEVESAIVTSTELVTENGEEMVKALYSDGTEELIQL